MSKGRRIIGFIDYHSPLGAWRGHALYEEVKKELDDCENSHTVEHKKPEVGDIWEDEDGRRYFVFKKSRKYVHLVVKRLRYKTGFSFTQRSPERITNYWRFVGKSTINLNKMFEVRDE